MLDVGKDLAVQSFCFRGFKKNSEVAECVKQCGLSKLELSGAHVDFSDSSACKAALNVYRDAGIDIVSIGVAGLWYDVEKGIPAFEFAAAAGIQCVGTDFTPDAIWDGFHRAEELADKYDLNLAIHNHGGRHWLGNTTMLKAVFANTGPRIGLELDTAWALDAGEDPVAMVKEFGDRLYGIHLKDFVFDRARKPEDVSVGSGVLDVPGLFAALREIDFNGVAVLEYEGDVDDPVPAVTRCVEAVRKEWSNG